tara:strand:+ start:11963 stop:12640 length:678 start_codon:yes stop_codon:yes gene_type:complete
MRNIKYLLFCSLISVTESHARDSHFAEEIEAFSVQRVGSVTPLPPWEKVAEDDPEIMPTSLQVIQAKESVVEAVKKMTLADVLSGLRGESSSLLTGWSSAKMSGFILDFNEKYEALGIKEKKKKLRNLQGDLENIKGSKKKKKKKGKALRIAELEETIESLKNDIADFTFLEDRESLRKIKVTMVSSTHSNPWALSVKLGLESEASIPVRFLVDLKKGLGFLVDI